MTAGPYIGGYLGRVPARPADPGRMINATPPTVHVGSPPRPPGHPESAAAVQPGPHPGPGVGAPSQDAMVNTGSPIMQLLAHLALTHQQTADAMPGQGAPAPQQPDALAHFLLTRAPNAV